MVPEVEQSWGRGVTWAGESRRLGVRRFQDRLFGSRQPGREHSRLWPGWVQTSYGVAVGLISPWGLGHCEGDTASRS